MEQNTDRMYWTIGIIVIGALLIAGALALLNKDNGLLGDVGAKLKDLFNMKPAAPVATIIPFIG